MKTKLFKRTIASLSALAMVGTTLVVPLTASAAVYADQAVDLSKFDSQGTYNSETGVESLALGARKWSKLDLKPYTQKGSEHVKSITISYKETVPSAGRTAIGIYDADKAVYATNAYQDTAGSFVCYGIMGSNTQKRTYLNSVQNAGSFAVDAEETVSLTFDMDDKTFSGNVGDQKIPSTGFGSLDSVDTFAVYSWSACTYTISDMKISVETADETYYDVTYDIKGKTTTESVMENGNVKEVPDTYVGGYTFKGWTKDEGTDLYSTDEIKAMAITGATKFTAQYDVDASYVEKIASVSITGADKMTFGPDPDTAEANAYSVVITGVDGTNITEENLSSNVKDFKVVWDIDGFKTANDTEGQYCDSYGAFETNNEGKVSTNFNLRNVPMNFIGMMTATITYNGETVVAKKAVAALGNTTVPQGHILPEGGYPSDFNNYADGLVGYTASVSANNQIGSDVVTGNIFIAGSDAGRKAELMSEGGEKFFRVTKTTASKSDMFAHQLNVTPTQVIYDNKVRFNSANSVITFTQGYPIWSSSSSYKDIIGLTFTGTAITLGGTALTKNDVEASFQTGVWYDVVISVDPSAGSAWAKVYSESGELLGEASNVALTTAEAPTYWAVGLANAATGSMDIKGYDIYYPTADESAYDLTASQDTLSIPNGDTADLKASLKTAEGYDITGAATWAVVEEDMQEGVIVTPDASDSHKAKVTLAESASAGEATVQVNIGGYTKTIKLNITSSAESVKFTKSSSSVSIPLDDSTTSAEYAAIVVDGEGKDLGRSVTYAVYDKNNTSVYTLPAGITFENGVLSVTKEAPAVTFTIRATGKNTDGEDISKSIKVTVHGLSFDFGAASDDAVAEGYTAVSADTSYTEARGYGIASGSVTAGGTASTEDAKTDYLEGAMTFKANVTKGKNYTVEITYQGEVRTGYINSDLAGYPLETTDNYGTAKVYDSLTTVSYTVPVVTDTLDLIISGNGAKIAAVTITKNADKAPNAKPDIHHVGDSTAANSGSWAYYIDHNRSSFPTIDAIATFYNNGAGGRNLCTYYTQGKLAGVLRAIEPGDIMMFGNNGTNGLGSFFEEDVNFYLDAAETMGAKIIINSYTPHGAVGGFAGGYDSATHTFTSFRTDSGDPITRAVAEQRASSDPNYLGFVEIGKNADAAFNAFVADYAANGYESADAAAQAIISCFSDHNHYSEGAVARDLMLNGYGDVKGIVEQIVDILSGTPVETQAPSETPTPVPAETPTPVPTDEPVPTDAPTPTPVPTDEPVPTDAPTPTPVPTDEPVPTDAPTPTPVPTDAPAAAPIVFDGDKTVTVTTNEKAAVLVHAKYKDGRLKAVDITELADAALSEALTDGKAVITKTDISNGDNLMLWKSIASQEPIGEVLVVDNVEVNPDIDQEATDRLIWKAEDVTYTAGQDLGNGLSLVFGTAAGATPFYKDFDTEGDNVAIKKIIGGVEFTGYVTASSANGSWKDSAKTLDPAKATAIKYTAAKDGVLTVYLDNVTKALCVGKDGMTKNEVEVTNSIAPEDAPMAHSFNVKTGETYYVYVAGSKGRFVGVGFEEGAHIDEPEPTEQPPAEDDTEVVAVGDGVVWSADDIAAADYTATISLNGLFIGAGDGQSSSGSNNQHVTIDASNKKFGETQYAQRIKTNGKGDPETKIRTLYFKPDSDCTMTLNAATSNSTDNRNINVKHGTANEAITLIAGNTDSNTVELKANELVIIYSTEGAFNIYGISLSK